MKKLSGFFYRFSSGWITMAALVIFLVFSFLTLPAQTALTETYSHGAGSPDTSLFYSRLAINQMAERFGEEGRSAYLQARWTFDLAFPVIYTFFLVTSISFVFKRGVREGSFLKMFNLVPVAAMVFDFAENISASVVMAGYPTARIWAASLASFFTPIKWFFVTISMLLLVVGLILWLGRKISSSKHESSTLL
jgi:hypothetical protein